MLVIHPAALRATTDQGYVFLTMLCVGVLMGLLFDLFRGLHALLGGRSLEKKNAKTQEQTPNRSQTTAGGWLLTVLLDLLFWVVCAVLCWLVLLEVSLGEVRFFSFLGIALGMVWHFALLSPAIVGAFRRMNNKLHTAHKDGGEIAKGLGRALWAPFERLRDHFWGW